MSLHRSSQQQMEVLRRQKKGCTGGGGGGIFMILSPAKTLNLSPDIVVPTNLFTNISSLSSSSSSLSNPSTYCNVIKTNEIATYMKQQSVMELKKLLTLSPKLASTSYEYWQHFKFYNNNDDDNDNNNNCDTTSTTTNMTTIKECEKKIEKEKLQQAKQQQQQQFVEIPCIYAFSGPAYQGIQISSIAAGPDDNNNNDTLLYMNDYLRILDPVYGLLRPFDLIQPYRLEMGVKNMDLGGISTNNNSKETKNKTIKLHDYWSRDITKSLTNDLNHGSIVDNLEDNNNNNTTTTMILLNLASEEYSCAIHVHDLPKSCIYIKIIFWEPNQKMIAVHSKRARGLMVRYLCDIQASTIQEIQNFQCEGYTFLPNQSTTTTFIFHRTQKTTTTTTTTTASSSVQSGEQQNEQEQKGNRKTKNNKTTVSKVVDQQTISPSVPVRNTTSRRKQQQEEESTISSQNNTPPSEQNIARKSRPGDDTEDVNGDGGLEDVSNIIVPKRNRISFFNKQDGKRLRLSIDSHELLQKQKVARCILCRMNTTCKCGKCGVPLCRFAFHDNRKSCWDKHHTNQRIEKAVR